MFDHFSTLYMKSLTDIVKANVDRVNSLVYYVANTYSLMSVGSKKKSLQSIFSFELQNSKRIYILILNAFF